MSLICGALKWLVDSEEREKAKIEAVLAGKLLPSALEEPSIVSHGSEESESDKPTTGSSKVTQGCIRSM